jgi:serine/threonine-protein kinase
MTMQNAPAATAEMSVIAERYELHARYPYGGMGAVFRGWDRRLSCSVAVKVVELPAALHDYQRHTREPWWWEAWVMAAVRHPHIVSVFEAFRDREYGYIVMELVEGYNLKRHLDRTGPLPCEEALTATIQICQALHALHTHGFIHCDVKPHNILRTSIGWVKLADFGVAQEIRSWRHQGAFTYPLPVESDRSSGVLFGTPAYCSPEQALRRPLTVATDIYSLGVVLYELLAGAPPFDGETPLKVVAQHAVAQAPKLRLSRPDVPALVEQIIIQAMSKQPDQRFASAQAMGVALEYARTSVAHESALRAQMGNPRDPVRLTKPCAPPSEVADHIAAMDDPGKANSDSLGQLVTKVANAAMNEASPRALARIEQVSTVLLNVASSARMSPLRGFDLSAGAQDRYPWNSGIDALSTFISPSASHLESRSFADSLCLFVWSFCAISLLLLLMLLV